MSPKREQLPPIVSTCYFNASRKGEHFIPDHVFSYQIAGTMVVNDGQREYVFIPGEFRFFKRNQLARYTKLPPPDGGGFKTMAICFSQKVLREFSATYGYAATKKDTGPAFRHLTDTAMYKSYMDSLIPYLVAEQQMDEDLINLKLKEALLILLKVNPELKDVLFDFTEPGKIDLEAFMQKNFHFKVGLQRFAYMTGRSLATFKRDFEKIFNLPPSRWLVQRRLQEAYYRIKELGKRPSEVYMELGFEDFSHFSYAFRQAYGVAPSKLKPGL
jgi:AraC-like DNA-binding protein